MNSKLPYLVVIYHVLACIMALDLCISMVSLIQNALPSTAYLNPSQSYMIDHSHLCHNSVMVQFHLF